jgi:hypothetical protein
MLNRRQAIYGGLAIALLPTSIPFATTDLALMVRQEYMRNLQIVRAGRDILRSVSLDSRKAGAMAEVSALCGTLQLDWYRHCRSTNEAAIHKVDPKQHIGLVYSMMAMFNSETFEPRAFQPMIRLFDCMARCSLG